MSAFDVVVFVRLIHIFVIFCEVRTCLCPSCDHHGDSRAKLESQVESQSIVAMVVSSKLLW